MSDLVLRIVLWLSRRLPSRLITNEIGDVYLERYRVVGWMPGSKWRWPFSVYLHHIKRADEDKALHNHPWRWSFSVKLHGGYIEQLPGEVYRRAPWIHWVGRGYHRVDSVSRDCWTLFVVGHKASSWGFLVPGRGHVEWRERLRERGINPSY
jgi:hypothetical protein